MSLFQALYPGMFCDDFGIWIWTTGAEMQAFGLRGFSQKTTFTNVEILMIPVSTSLDFWWLRANLNDVDRLGVGLEFDVF